MGRLFATILLLTLTACGPLLAPDDTPKQVFTLSGELENCDQTRGKKAPKLLLPGTTASALVSSQRILFSKEIGTRAAYQYASWSEPPPRALSRILLNKLRCSGIFSEVASSGTPIEADFSLKTELEDFFHDASEAPGSVRIVLLADLINLNKNELSGFHRFDVRVPAQSYDAAGAVVSFRVAVEELANELETWLETQAPSGKTD